MRVLLWVRPKSAHKPPWFGTMDVAPTETLAQWQDPRLGERRCVCARVCVCAYVCVRWFVRGARDRLDISIDIVSV
jgi:hypothetical protein